LIPHVLFPLPRGYHSPVHRTRIKFCGITRPTDAEEAANAGADAIGLIFYARSSRHVTIPQGREILRALPPMVSPVGLFVDASVQEILQTSGELNLRTVQLHGSERPDILASLVDLTIIKAIRCTAANLAALDSWKHAAGILLETAGTPEPGGSGVANDWALIQSAVESSPSHPPLIAAGGLTPENVAQMMRRIRPWAVDVSTGIEESPGVKSIEKMRKFAAAVRAADS
jgi:phosphoribosylanthranilate isomerase